ncbi:unnamed protein product [Urochloa humidicola]
MENGDETLAYPTPPPRRPRPTAASWKRSRPIPVTTHPGKSYAVVTAESPAPNGGVAKEEEQEEGGTGTHITAKSYTAVTAQAEIEDLHAAKLDLEGKLTEAQRENEANAKEAHRVEGVFARRRSPSPSSPPHLPRRRSPRSTPRSSASRSPSRSRRVSASWARASTSISPRSWRSFAR